MSAVITSIPIPLGEKVRIPQVFPLERRNIYTATLWVPDWNISIYENWSTETFRKRPLGED
jgi:hypothetical protein